MRRTKVFPVFLLFVLSVLAMLFAATSTRKPVQKKTIRNKSEDMEIICPKLHECGDAFLISNQFGAMMIDTGEKADGDLLLDLLRKEGINALDILVLTHFDKDHIGGAPAMLRIPAAKSVHHGFLNGLLMHTSNMLRAADMLAELYQEVIDALEANGTEIVFLTKQVSLNRLSADISIYPPLSMIYKEGQDNNLSLVTSIKYRSSALLFMGDAEKDRVSEFFLNQYDYTKYDFVKVPHHGRDELSTDYLLYVVNPSDVLITSSREEPENPEVLEKFQAAGAKIWLTKDGTVTMTVKEDGLSISQ